MTGPPQALDSLSTSDSMAGDGAASGVPMPQIAANDHRLPRQLWKVRALGAD